MTARYQPMMTRKCLDDRCDSSLGNNFKDRYSISQGGNFFDDQHDSGHRGNLLETRQPYPLDGSAGHVAFPAKYLQSTSFYMRTLAGLAFPPGHLFPIVPSPTKEIAAWLDNAYKRGLSILPSFPSLNPRVTFILTQLLSNLTIAQFQGTHIETKGISNYRKEKPSWHRTSQLPKFKDLTSKQKE
ncbi:hypothetical protein PGT21_012785 [Puccinia graminis f. sp. tritici]|uniref:Uncharacterized protein n=1 Tax=Puccinia graminis f. sp. tritici TaxID=56615 RepID=A0A5B0LMQ4_PUCGR|nr:hypothetical protein PGTUg99_001363 [Puccinia graminis f. sp. tritici]KAA1090759.1 hypothetical protein PGT21_012785 [Puccinia graminis f. sp. tritici]